VAKRRKGIKPGDKGNRFELAQCRAWEAWLGCPFIRRAQYSEHLKRIVSGDIAPEDPEIAARFMLSVELKHREKWDFESMLSSNKAEVYGWWQQCVWDALTGKRGQLPIMVFKRNYRPPLVGFSPGLIGMAVEVDRFFHGPARFEIVGPDHQDHTAPVYLSKPLFILTFKDFVDRYPQEEFWRECDHWSSIRQGIIEFWQQLAARGGEYTRKKKKK
jgi:hypothetical protein